MFFYDRCISHIHHDWHSLRGLTVWRNLKRLCWHEAKWPYFAACFFVLFVCLQTCILHPEIKCTTVTTHINTETKPPPGCRKYLISAEDACMMWKRCWWKLLQKLVYVYQNLQQAAPSLHQPCFIYLSCDLLHWDLQRSAESWASRSLDDASTGSGRAVDAFLHCSKWIIIISNVEKIACVSS